MPGSTTSSGLPVRTRGACARATCRAFSVFATLVTVASGVSAQVVIDQAASILIYPEVVADGTRDTTIQIANTANSVEHARCFYVDVSGGEIDFAIDLTLQQPTLWVASFGREPGIGNPVPPLGSSFQGELVCVEVNAAGAPVGGNHLIGEGTIADTTSGDVAKYHAVGLQGIGINNGDNVLCLGGGVTSECPTGAEYAACPQSWLLDFVFDGTEDSILGAGSAVHTNLTFFPCTLDLLRQVPAQATVQFLVSDQFARRFSTSKRFQGALFDTPVTSIGSVFGRTILGTDYGHTVMSSAGGSGFIAIGQELHTSGTLTASEALSPYPQGTHAAGDLITLPPMSAPLPTVLVSANSAGTGGGNGDSGSKAISADGRFVAFNSLATDLIAGFVDGNGQLSGDVYVRDVCVSGSNPVAGCTPSTALVSVNSAGTAGGNGDSFDASISADGRFVAFTSDASDLAANDMNGNPDVFVRDRCLSNGSPVAGCAPTTTLISVNTAGAASGNGGSQEASISADARFVAFTSFASDLVPNDSNGVSDVFVRDLATSAIELISVGGGGTLGNSESNEPSISADGCIVAFASNASNFAANDTNAVFDVFVRDRCVGTTELVSMDNAGTAAGNARSVLPSISADGRFVAFTSDASDLVVNDTNGFTDVFVRDRFASSTEVVSVSSNGSSGNASAGLDLPSISGDGRFVAFASDATNLAANDANGSSDVFVRDRSLSVTTLVSVNSAGSGSGNGASFTPVMSADGSAVSFVSRASDLVPNDTNASSDVFWRPVR